MGSDEDVECDVADTGGGVDDTVGDVSEDVTCAEGLESEDEVDKRPLRMPSPSAMTLSSL